MYSEDIKKVEPAIGYRFWKKITQEDIDEESKIW